MRNVLLTILPVFWPKMPPLGLGFLQSYLLDKGIDAEIFDLNNIFYNLADADLKKKWLISCNTRLENSILSTIQSDYPEAYKRALDKMLGFEAIGFSCFKSNFAVTAAIIAELKSKRKDIKIILGGPEITRQFLKTGGKFDSRLMRVSDYFVVGEGEKPLCEYLDGGTPAGNIAAFEQLSDLSELPFPRYEGLDLAAYLRKDALPLQFSRGCVRQCDFCAERLLYKGFRARNVEEVIDEIKYHKTHHKTDYFVFFDSLINGDLAALEDFCRRVIDNFGSINWEAQIAIRGDMSQAVMEKMKRSGCYNLFVGLESGSDKTLARMNKGFTSKEAEDFFLRLGNAGLFFGVSMIVGYPGETDTDFKESLDFIIRNRDILPKIEQVNPFTYYDGTPADKKYDYKINRHSSERMEIFIKEIKRNNFKYTNAFLGNLIEK
jgi:radical SAM superfamily enzyme YgiQ (UPF0313 family)